ncbi:MAG: nucleoside hydrolase [Boseongicola sp. SB0662_bin_57]|nr:nucleoside hydrolase [Boseongicola sp. SB0662_bin_57]
MPTPASVLERFPKLDPDFVRARLARPESKPRVIIDTDTANEIDDQFAVAWSLLSEERMALEGVTAEPFSFAHHQEGLIRSTEILERGGPANEEEERFMGGLGGWAARLVEQGISARDIAFVGTEEGERLSYEEILRVFERCGVDSAGRVFHGSPRYLGSVGEPVDSPAARFIIERALADDRPLYILAMGAVTNIASALLIEPRIIERIVVVWTSAFPSYSPFCNRPSLNLVQDPPASRLMFDCGVPLVYLPGYHVGAQLKISLPEMERFVRGRGDIGDYLHHLYANNPLHEMFAIAGTETKTWVIWDIVTVAWLFDAGYVSTFLTTSPLLDDDLYWQHPNGRHPILEAFDLNRDAIFEDFYRTLERAP